MSASGPALWLRIAQLVAKTGPISSLEIADGLQLPRHSTSFSCGAMARRGYLQCVGKTRRPTRREGSRSQSRIYVVTPAGAALDAPPPADARDERPIAHGFGHGKCALAQCFGLERR